MRQSGCCEQCDKSFWPVWGKATCVPSRPHPPCCAHFSPLILPPPHHFTPGDSSVPPSPTAATFILNVREVRAKVCSPWTLDDASICGPQHPSHGADQPAVITLAWTLLLSHAAIELWRSWRFISESVKVN